MTPCTALRIAILAEWILFAACFYLSGNYKELTPLAIASLVFWLAGTVGLFTLQGWAVYLYMGGKLLMTRWWSTPKENETGLLQILEMLNWFIFGAILFLVFFGHATGQSKKR